GPARRESATNRVSLRTEPILARVRELPSVRDASIAIGLPGTVELRVVERRPIVVWQVGEQRYAVDEGGLLFADVTSDPSGATATIPIVVDERVAASGLGVRSTL